MASEYPSGQMKRSPPCLDRLSKLPVELIDYILKFVPIRDAVQKRIIVGLEVNSEVEGQRDILEMASEFPSSQRTRSTFSSDRLSNLPKELIDKILKLMPVRDAARTSALSRNWRYRWMTISGLVFDARAMPSLTSTQGQRYTKLVDVVNHVLFLHDGMLYNFGITMYLEPSSSDVDRWILMLARKFVKELVFNFLGEIRYKVPSSLFSCQKLSVLKLHCVILKSPSHTKGFNSLAHLYLSKVTFTNETIESLVSDSPLVRRLSLIHCDGFSCLNIYAPNLRTFFIRGPCGNIYFHYSPKLKCADIGTLPLALGGLPPTSFGPCRFEVVMAGILSLEELYISKSFVEILAGCVLIPERLRVIYHRLSILSMVMNLDNSKEVSLTLCLLRSAPHLQTVEIVSCATRQFGCLTNDEFWNDLLRREEIIFPKLETIELYGFRGTEHELKFVQFILLKAVKLQSMNIIWDATVQVGLHTTRILEGMMKLRRASATSAVYFWDDIQIR